MLAAATATGLLWLVVWGLIYGWYPELQRRLVLEAIDRGLHMDAELAAVRGSLAGGFTLEALVLRPAASSENPTDEPPILLSADRIEISLDLVQLFEQRLVAVESVDAEGVAIELERTDDGQWQLVGAVPDPSQGNLGSDEAIRVSVERVRLRNARISARWRDPIGPGHLVAKGMLSTRDITWSSADGLAIPANFAADLRLSDGGLGPLQLSSGQLEANRSGEHMHLTLEGASVRAEDLGQFLVSGSAAVDLSNAKPTIAKADAQIGFSGLDLAEAASFQATTGALPSTRLNGELRVGLSNKAEQDLVFSLVLDPSRVESFAFDSASAEGRYDVDGGHWRVRAAEVDTRFGKIAGSAVGSHGSFEALTLDAAGLRVGAMLSTLGIESNVAGHFDLAARLAGPARNPLGQVLLEGVVEVGERPAVAALLEIGLLGDDRLQLDQLELSTGEPASLRFTNISNSQLRRQQDGWVLSDLRLRGLAGDVTIAVARSDGERLDVELELDELELRPLSDYLGRGQPAAGTLTGPLSIVRAAGKTRLDADLVWHEPRYAALAAERIRFYAHSNEDTNAIDASIDYGAPGPATISARLPSDNALSELTSLTSDPGFGLSISAEEVPAHLLETLFAQRRGLAEPLAGTLSGEFHAEGSADGPRVRGSATWQGARFGSALADDVSLECRSEAGELLVDLEISHEGRNGFVAAASIDLANWLAHPASLLGSPNNHASLRAQGVDLAWLVPRASARRLGRIERLRGTASGQLTIQGDPAGPRLDGELFINSAELHLALVDEPVGPISGELRFSNDGIRVERFEVASSKGPAIITGSYRWDAGDGQQLQLHTRFEKFALTHFPLLDARVQGNLDLTGSLDALDADGSLVFKHVQVNLPTPEDPLFREVRILGLEGDDAAAADPQGSAKPSAYQSMRADIDIDVRRGARIRERGADLEAQGLFRLRKKRLSPTLLQGSLETTHGTYTFLGRKFDVTQGTATFEERIPPDPELHIVATKQYEDVTVGVELTGRWSDRQSRLISVPEMDNTEILSYLVLGKPSSQLGQGDDAQINAAAAQLAGNLALSQLSRALSDKLPINEISMKVDEDLTVATIGVETNVGEDILLRYDRALQTGVQDRLTVEWRFWKNLSLRSEYSNGGSSGLDLFWSYEY